jgi:AAA15 family ATPase/GTPase
MILEFKIANFLSFKDEVVFSFEATKDNSFEEYQVVEVAPGIRVLKIAIVYGANASGKSNLINAFDFLKQFWFTTKDNKDEKTGTIPFLLDQETPHKPSKFSLTFYVNETKYIYTLELDRKRVCLEKIDFYPGTQPANLFIRQLKGSVSEITFNSSWVKISKTAKDEIVLRCLPNMSVLAAYNQVNISIPEIEEVIKWMKAQFIKPVSPNTRLDYMAKRRLEKGVDDLNSILNYLNKADFNITNISTEEVEEEIPDNIFDLIIKRTEISDKEKYERMKKERTYKIPDTFFEHKVINNAGNTEVYKLPIRLQSDGTKRTFGLSSVIINAIEKNAFLAIDEIESSLHPKLVEFILEDFLKHQGRSQLLITTHYDGLLEQDDLLRKDSIWFTSKKDDGSTDLYSLTEFKGLNRISSLLKAYQGGRFGAVPDL